MNSPKIATVGDIALVGRYNKEGGPDHLKQVKAIFRQHDLVIGNLESALTDKGQPVPGKCTLRGRPEWAIRLREAGVHVLSLANNHLMDYGPEGLLDTIDNLKHVGIKWLGAGNNIREARAPLYTNVSGNKIALVARTSVYVASPSYADDKTPGVARFELQETLSVLKDCKAKADLVILLLHWGLEDYRYPTPSQRALATQLIDAGADFIIGHHPHVLQGMESIGNGAVAYSLGNFLFDHFDWHFTNRDGILQKQEIRLSPMQCQAGIFILKEKDKKTTSPFDFIPTYIDNNAIISLDLVTRRKTEVKRLSRPFQWPGYSIFWRLHALEREWRLRILPLVLGKFTWEKIKKVRPKHFKQLIRTLRRSASITTERSTNPYD